MRKFLRSPIGISLLLSLALWQPLLSITDIPRHVYWNTAFHFVTRPAPSSVVVVSVDGMPELDTATEARVLEGVRRQMPRQVFVDLRIPYGLDASGDKQLKAIIDSYGTDVAFVARASEANRKDKSAFTFPAREIAGKHPIYVSSWNDNFIHAAVSAPYSVTIGERTYPAFAVALAGLKAVPPGTFYPDFTVDPATIPQVSARTLLQNGYSPGLLTGRTVVITASNGIAPMRYLGHGIKPPVSLDIAGAEGLKRPLNADLSFLPLLLLAVSVLKPVLVPRYLLWSAVPFFVLAGVGATALSRHWRPAVVVLLPLLCLVNLWPVYRVSTKPRWDRAAAALAAAVQPGDTVYAVDPNGPAMLETLQPRGEAPIASKVVVTNQLDVAVARGKAGSRVWAVNGRSALGSRKSDEAVEASLAALGPPERSVALDREITLLEFSPPPAG